jgi:predicted dehydrogenase
MHKVRVAIVGCGAVARRHHVPVFAKSRCAEVVALCDTAKEPILLLEERFRLGARHYCSIDEMLRDHEVDVVDICTPGFTHFEYAKLAIRESKHVLLEKPPVYTCEQARELKALSEAAGVKLGIVLNWRYRPLIRELKAAINRGLLGTVVKVQANHHANLVFSESEWLWDESRSKYLLYEFGIHLLDLMVHFCGPHESILCAVPTRQESVETTTDLQSIIHFQNGALGIIDFTQDSTRHSAYFTHLNVYGTAQDAFYRHSPPTLTFRAGQVAPHECLLDEVKAFAHLSRLLITGKFREYRNISHQHLIEDYLAWVVHGEPYPLTIDSVIPTLRLLNDLETYIPAYNSPR